MPKKKAAPAAELTFVDRIEAEVNEIKDPAVLRNICIELASQLQQTTEAGKEATKIAREAIAHWTAANQQNAELIKKATEMGVLN
jgi:hypothetical protein